MSPVDIELLFVVLYNVGAVHHNKNHFFYGNHFFYLIKQIITESLPFSYVNIYSSNILYSFLHSFHYRYKRLKVK